MCRGNESVILLRRKRLQKSLGAARRLRFQVSQFGLGPDNLAADTCVAGLHQAGNEEHRTT